MRYNTTTTANDVSGISRDRTNVRVFGPACAAIFLRLHASAAHATHWFRHWLSGGPMPALQPVLCQSQGTPSYSVISGALEYRPDPRPSLCKQLG